MVSESGAAPLEVVEAIAFGLGTLAFIFLIAWRHAAEELNEWRMRWDSDADRWKKRHNGLKSHLDREREEHDTFRRKVEKGDAKVARKLRKIAEFLDPQEAGDEQ